MQSVNNFKFKSIPIDLSSIAFDMAEGSLTEIKEIFFIEGKYAPIIRWCSFPQNDWPRPHQIICEFWRSHNTINEFTIENLEKNVAAVRVKPFLAIISKQDNDYEYEFIGDRYRNFHNISDKPETLLKTLDETNEAIPLLNYTLLSATTIRGQGVLCLYQAGTDTRPELWNKLTLPLMNGKGLVEKFVVCALRSPA